MFVNRSLSETSQSNINSAHSLINRLLTKLRQINKLPRSVQTDIAKGRGRSQATVIKLRSGWVFGWVRGWVGGWVGEWVGGWVGGWMSWWVDGNSQYG